ncbi:hypothetical protein AK812_SmicGene40008 [Symbiodinium microadriaticum]|uniref:Uncharacterized protein n=1 Tax=Symbiodinium microadriaticum TaxID=2951 RepID=A0A1Q9C9T3_SYMMI|nr:hypothetical protein AK812_SmicGene40008 [Symbiodinium microadriaticum]
MDINMEDVKEEAGGEDARLEHFFQEAGLKKARSYLAKWKWGVPEREVIGDCAKLEFKGEGHEFEDLKDNFEDLIWKSRSVLEKKEPDCNPREELHKSAQTLVQEVDESGSAPPEYRCFAHDRIVSGIGGTHQVAENRARALERKRQMPCLVRFVGSEATTRQREAAVEEAQEEAMAAQAAQAQAEPDFEEEDVRSRTHSLTAPPINSFVPSPMMQTVHGLPDVGSHGIWLDLEESGIDFVSCDDKLQEDDLRSLSFPSNWQRPNHALPAAYQSDALRALIGKRGRLPGKRVAVAGEPSPAEQGSVECHAMAAQKKEKNPFLPDQGQSCWIWFAPKTGKNDEKPSTRDAAALPHNAAAHEARLQKGLWGKKAYRLSPAVFVADAFDGTALVRERSATGMASIKVKAGLILPWYEGLLVLEELMRKNENEDSCPWVTELLDVILKEKSQRNISASLYVSKSLLNAAVTGPAFVTREGRIVAHRRSPLRDDSQLTEAEVSPPGWYRVDRLERYLPPWEAFAHPKCGLYQDFYLVQWSPPLEMESFEDTPQGEPGFPKCTWEPDECLPDDLDALRISAKKRWLEGQKEREKKVTRNPSFTEDNKEQARGTKRMANGDVAETAKATFRDVSGKVLHGLREELKPEISEEEKGKIKEGWPKHEGEYPTGYGPAMPPGFCQQECRCMEDWHVGEVDLDRKWLKNALRDQAVERAVSGFKLQEGMLRIRGGYSGHAFLEPLRAADREFALSGFQRQRQAATQVAMVVIQCVKQAVMPLPLAAALDASAGDLLHSLYILDESKEEGPEDDGHAGGPFQPLRFEKLSGPDWILVDQSTGRIGTIAKDTPRAFKAESFTVAVDFCGVVKRWRMDLKIGPNKPPVPENLRTCTAQIMDVLGQVPQLKEKCIEMIKLVYDDQSKSVRKKVTLAHWLRQMKKVYIMARAFSSMSRLKPLPPTPVAGVTSGPWCYPLQSFSNAEQLSAKLRPQPTGKSECCKFQFPRSRLGLVRGWTVYERGDRSQSGIGGTVIQTGLHELLLVEAPGSEKQRGASTSVQVDSDEEEAPQRREDEADVGVKDLAEGKTKKKPVLPVPDFLQGSTAGGGGTNCLLSLLKLLDSEEKKEVFGRSFHSAMLDRPRTFSWLEPRKTQIFKGGFPYDFSEVVLGIGSVLPLLEAARSFRGILLETPGSTKLAEVIKEGLDNAEAVRDTISRKLPKAASVCVVTERMAHDLLSNGIVPACALRHCGAKSIRHLPKTVELLAAPAEIRSERLLEFDLRPFNTLRADLRKTLCGFDFDRSPEITLDEVRRPMKLQADKRGVAVWWVAKPPAQFGDEEYSTRPDLENRDAPPNGHSEWKQAVHYLAGETSVFQGDVIAGASVLSMGLVSFATAGVLEDLQVSVTPRFTFRMMQESLDEQEANFGKGDLHRLAVGAILVVQLFGKHCDATEPRNQEATESRSQEPRSQEAARPNVSGGAHVASWCKPSGKSSAADPGCWTQAQHGPDAIRWRVQKFGFVKLPGTAVVAANAALITEKRGMVNLLLVVGEDVAEKFDIVRSSRRPVSAAPRSESVMDLWCLGAMHGSDTNMRFEGRCMLARGEGIIPTMRHAHKKLLAETGVLGPWCKIEREDAARTIADLRATAGTLLTLGPAWFSAVRIDQFPRWYLTDEPIVAMEVNLSCVPPQPAEGEPNVENDVKLCIRMGGKAALRAKVSSARVLAVSSCRWSRISHQLGLGPAMPTRSWKQLIRWLDAPRFVSAGEDIQVLTCYNDHQVSWSLCGFVLTFYKSAEVNVEDIYLPREMVDKYQEELLAAQSHAAGGEQQKPNAETEELIEAESVPQRSPRTDVPWAFLRQYLKAFREGFMYVRPECVDCTGADFITSEELESLRAGRSGSRDAWTLG